MTDQVWKTTETEHYTRALSRPNRYGAMSSACSRKVVSWTARINGRVVGGFATKKAALAAVAEQEVK